LSVISILELLSLIELARALGFGVSLGASRLVLIGSASLLLPITINGIGLQENLYVILLNSYGVSEAPALLFALLIRFQMLFLSFIGGIFALIVINSPIFKEKLA
jgi:hypothetical protein